MKYMVCVQEVHTGIVYVDCNNEIEAREKVMKILEEEEIDTAYSYTLPTTDWTVIEISSTKEKSNEKVD